MVTPFNQSDGNLNEAALRKLTNHLIDGGVHGLFVVGSQGEFWALTADEKKRAFETVLDETNGRVPVYAGTGGITTKEVVALTQLAESAGIDCVSVLSPFFLKPTEEDLYIHYRDVAASTKLPVPHSSSNWRKEASTTC